MSNKTSAGTEKALILGHDPRSFLTVIRSLGRRGICVHAAWCPEDSIARSSRYLAQYHPLPFFSPDSDAWMNALIDLLELEKYELVIPAEDETIIPLQIHRVELENHARIYLLDDPVYSVVSSKFETDRLAQSLNIPVADGMTVSSMNEIDILLSRFEFPMVLKPQTSFSSVNTTHRHSVKKAYCLDELQLQLGRMLDHGKVLVQQNFIGNGVGVEVLADRGDILVAFQHLRVHEPLMGGGSSYRVSVPLHPELLDAARKLMTSLHYTGVAMVEFKLNQRTGQWILVEINGRFWGSLPLSVSAGMDFPWYLYQLLVHGKRDFPQRYKSGVYNRYLGEDISWLVKNFRAPKSDQTLATQPLWRVAGEVIHWLTLREHSDTLVLDDLKPGLLELAEITKHLYIKLRRQAAMLLLSRFRAIRSKRVRAAFSKAHTILFVCMGNICRSPFAEFYCRKRMPESVHIISAGYYPEENRQSPVEALEAARDFGIRLDAHRSVRVNEQMLRQADIIFVFDQDNRESLVKEYNFAKNKIYYAGHLSADGPVIIKDPFGGSVGDYKQTYTIIARALDSGIASRSLDDSPVV